MEGPAFPTYKGTVHIYTGHAVGNSKLRNDIKTQVDSTKIQDVTTTWAQRMLEKQKNTARDEQTIQKPKEETSDGESEQTSSIQRNIRP